MVLGIAEPVQDEKRGLETRLAARTGRLSTHTCGAAPNAMQGNLVIVPQAFADDFADYCALNPKTSISARIFRATGSGAMGCCQPKSTMFAMSGVTIS